MSSASTQSAARSAAADAQDAEQVSKGADVRDLQDTSTSASASDLADATAEVVVWRDLQAEARSRLASVAAVDSPRVDARRIVEAASGASPAEYDSVLDEPVTTLAATRFRSMLQRRSRGEPLQYVVGSWGFRTLDLMVDDRVLIPRPETEVVAGWAVDEAARFAAEAGRDREVVVVDLGTGSGAIALSVAVECPRTRVFATDVSADALAVARANLAGAGRAAARVSLHEGNWFEALPEALQGAVDVVVSNPPTSARARNCRRRWPTGSRRWRCGRVQPATKRSSRSWPARQRGSGREDLWCWRQLRIGLNRRRKWWRQPDSSMCEWNSTSPVCSG